MNIHSIDQVIAGIIALIVTIVSFKSLKQCSTLDNPLISICVGILVFMSFRKMGASTLSGILIPYQALGISIVLMVLAMFIVAWWRRRSEDKPETPTEEEDL